MSAKNQKTIRAWKNPEFRARLSQSERDALPANPAGAIELDEEALSGVHGGLSIWTFCRTQCGVYCTITKQYGCGFTTPQGGGATGGASGGFKI